MTSEAADYNELLEQVKINPLSEDFIVRDLRDYDFFLNNTIPLVAEICFFLLAWYIFHYCVYTKITSNFNDSKGWVHLGLSILLLIAGIFVYYYFKLDVRLKFGTWRLEDTRISGLKVVGNFRKKRVFSDAVSFGILLFLLELTVRYYQNLVEKINDGYSWRFKLSDYLQAAFILLFCVWFAFDVRLDDMQPFMRSSKYLSEDNFYYKEDLLSEFIFIAGNGIIIFLLQNYFFQIVLVGDNRVRKIPAIRRVLIRLAFALILGYLIMIIYYLKDYHSSSDFYVDNDFSFRKKTLPEFLFTTFRYSLNSTAICVIIAVSISYLRRARTGTAERASLKAKIHPHFVYNTLGNLHSTALEENSMQTAEGILQLSELMRFMLKDSNQELVTIQKEVEYLSNYIKLQRKKLDQSRQIVFHVHLQETNREIALAPMLFQPLIENAFKHGISFSSPSWIFVTLTMDPSNIYFKVHNSFHTMEQKDESFDKSGVALENVQKRLNIIYPKRHQFVIQQTETDFFVAVTIML